MTATPAPLPNELTGIIGRDRFDDPPGDVTDPHDIERWHDFRRRYHAAQDLVTPEDFPLQVDVELTSQCNLRCSFCVHGQEVVGKSVLDRGAYERIVLEGEQHGLVSMKFNYINEPLLVQDIPEYLTFAKQHGVLNTYFATNGTLLNERMRHALIDARLSKAMVSIDAASAETYQTMRKSAHYDRIVKNIYALLDLRQREGVTWPLVRVNFLKTHLNAHEADDFIRMWTGVADAIGFQDQVALPGRADDIFRDAGDIPLDEFRCSFPSKQLVVDSFGHILPCCTFSGREMPLGSIHDMTLAEAWRSRQMLLLRDSHRDGTWRDNPVCRQCIYGDAPTAAPATTATFIEVKRRT